MNVTAVLSQPAAGQQHPSMAGRGANGMVNGGPGPNRPQQPQDPSSAASGGPPELPEMSPEEVDASRSREITTKAITGILLLLLKWLRVSRKQLFQGLRRETDLSSRRSQIRVHDATSAGFELPPAGPETVRAPRHTASRR